MAISPKSAGIKERERAVSTSETEIRFIADEKLLKKLKRLQELAAHRLGAGTPYADLIDWLADLGLAKLELESSRPGRQSSRKQDRPPQLQIQPVTLPQNSALVGDPTEHHVKPTVPVSRKTPRSRSRYIPTAIKRKVWVRDQGCCTFVDSQSGRRCESRSFIQIDHVQPFALGGRSDDPSNLRLLCFQHNQLEAQRWFQAG